MRIDHDTLMKITLELVDDRIREDRNLVSVYLCGSLLEGEYLLGGTTDVDLVFIHYDEVLEGREILPLTEDVHLDIAHHSQNLYRTPRSIRVHPWLGPTIKECRILHDPQHFMDFTQASVRGQFERPDRVYERARAQVEKARKIWLGYQNDKPTPGPEEIYHYLKALENAANAIAGFNGVPLSDRHFLMRFPERAERIGKPGMAAGLFGMLGAPNIEDSALADFLPRWQNAFEALSDKDRPVRLHPARKAYYLNAFETMLESEQPKTMLWPLLRTWTLAAKNLNESAPELKEWRSALAKMRLLGEDFKDRLAGLDAYLDLIEDTIESWARKNGVWVE